MPAAANEIGMVIGFLLFIVFPLFVVVSAARQGQHGLATLTFVTTFVGLGPLVGLLTLLRMNHKI
jgi:hypothetical protein